MPDTSRLDMPLDELRADLADALSTGGSQYLLRLTDEELAVLQPRDTERSIAPTPHLRNMTGEQREWVLATALRSLVSRELVQIGNMDELDTLVRSEESGDTEVDVDMRITPEADLVLVLRRSADRALAVEQTTAGGTTYAFAYVHRPDLILIERVTAGGLHLFSLAQSADDAAEFLQLILDPFSIADEDGPVQRLGPEALDRDHVEPPLRDVIDNALVVGQAVVLADSPGPLVMTYATGSELWTVRVEKPQAPTGITARAVDQRSLRNTITELLLPPDAG
jgi:hypothetical protein